MQSTSLSIPRWPRATLLLLLAAALLLGGCAASSTGNNGDQQLAAAEASSESVVENQPYTPEGFSDLLIPSELTWNRDKSMVVQTASFSGGVLNFSGKVDIDSLSNFFIKTMAKNDWKLAGSVKYKNVLLAFVKPNKTCTITMADSDFGIRTEVNIYVTVDLTNNAPAAGM